MVDDTGTVAHQTSVNREIAPRPPIYFMEVMVAGVILWRAPIEQRKRKLTKLIRTPHPGIDRWAHIIRDDPYFHPGLSLYAHEIALA